MADERMRFVLEGRDQLSAALNRAGDAAARLRARIISSAAGSRDALNGFTRDANGRLRDMQGRFVRAGDAADESGGRMRRLMGTIGDLAGQAVRGGAALGKGGLGGALQGIGPAIGITALPALGALVPMVVGAGTAAVTAKMAFSGVGEAVALAGEDSKEYKKALKDMSPAQREFTKQVVSAKKEFGGLSKEVQGIVLPKFTRALKDARPAMGIFKGGIKDMAGELAGFGEEFGRLFGSDRFQSALRKNLQMGSGFIGSLARPLTTLTQALLDFGAASKPVLETFQKGIGGLLSKGLPGFFKGLEGGVKGSAAMFDGLFDAVNKVLPAFGELAGAIADAVGPALGEIMSSSGDTASRAMRGLAGVMQFTKPLFAEIGAFARIVSIGLGAIGSIAKQVGRTLLESFWPSFRDTENASGPLQRLAGWLKENKVQVMEFSRVASGFIIDFVILAVTQLPNVIKAFRFMVTGILTALDGVVSGAAKAFGWIPGIGDKLKAANRDFDKFKNGFITGLHQAEGKTRAFSEKVAPRLRENRLKMDIRNWNSQIAIAKRKLSNKNLPPSKKASLRADIRDLQRKVDAAKRKLREVKSRSVTVSVGLSYSSKIAAMQRQGLIWRGGLVADAFASGGRVQAFPGGGHIRGPGTGTSDSILAWVSNDEYVVRSAAVRKYGVAMMDAINSMQLPAPTRAQLPAPAPTPRPAGAPAPRGGGAPVYITVQGAIDPIGTARSIRQVLLELRRTQGRNINLLTP